MPSDITHWVVPVRWQHRNAGVYLKRYRKIGVSAVERRYFALVMENPVTRLLPGKIQPQLGFLIVLGTSLLSASINKRYVRRECTQ
jgi:hypothetical protein